MMHEDRIGQMVKEYGEGLPGFEPRVRRRRIAPVVLSLSGAAAIVLSVVLLTPSAEARAYGRMVNALKGAKTIEADTFVRRIDGRYTLEAREWLKGTSYAFERFAPRPALHKIIASTPDGYVVNYMAAGVTTREPENWDGTLGKTSILDWVIARNDIGVDGAPKTMQRLDSPPIGGHPAYILKFDKRESDMVGYETIETVWVDSNTNLPIRCSVADKEPGRRWSEELTEYHFDVPVPDSVFAPRFQPVLDLAAREAELSAKWQREGVAHGEDAFVADAQMATDGSLYLLYVGDWAPTSVTGGEGEPYVRALSFHPGGVQSDTIAQKFEVGGRPVNGAIFVPAGLDAVRSPSFLVGFRHTTPNWDKVSALPGPEELLSVAAGRCRDWPDYTFDLVLSQFFLQAESQRAAAEAKALEKSGDIDDALRMYRMAYERRKNTFSTIAYRELVPAETMLRQVGRVKEADAVKGEIEAGRAVDPNVEVGPAQPAP